MRLVPDPALLPEAFHGSSIVVGNFDGVHAGHRELINRAHALGRTVGALTFEPHPKQVFGRCSEPFRLSTPRLKLEQLAAYGCQFAVVVNFTQEFSRLPPEVFIDTVLREQLRVGAVVVGERFAFGAGRAGDCAMLNDAAERFGFEAISVPAVVESGGVCSSTRIRAALKMGLISEAARLIGRPWQIEGMVVGEQPAEIGKALEIALGSQLRPGPFRAPVGLKFDDADPWFGGLGVMVAGRDTLAVELPALVEDCIGRCARLTILEETGADVLCDAI